RVNVERAVDAGRGVAALRAEVRIGEDDLLIVLEFAVGVPEHRLEHLLVALSDRPIFYQDEAAVFQWVHPANGVERQAGFGVMMRPLAVGEAPRTEHAVDAAGQFARSPEPHALAALDEVNAFRVPLLGDLFDGPFAVGAEDADAGPVESEDSALRVLEQLD